MPTIYCPDGHRISYTETRPTKCPTCHSSLEIKVTPKPPRRLDPDSDEDDAQIRRGRPAKEPKTAKRYRWEMDEDELEDEEDDYEDEAQSRGSAQDTDTFMPPALIQLSRRDGRGRGRGRGPNPEDIGITIQKDEGDSGPPTLEQLRASGGGPIERTESRGSAPAGAGNKVVTAAELVAEMCKNRPPPPPMSPAEQAAQANIQADPLGGERE